VIVYLSGRPVQTYGELEELYRRRITVSGFTSETLFYRNQQQHALKLRSFARLVAKIAAGQSMLDIGCGYGELLRFVELRGEYVGIDLVSDFVLEARRRYPRERFEVADLFDYDDSKPDWSLLVGVLSSVPTPRAVLSRAAELAQRGVIFDITLGERLPAGFVSLVRWSLEELWQLLNELSLVVTQSYDAGATWVMFKAEHRSTVEDARIGTSRGGE
jgi:SAM-dependent methyltransferase